MVPDLGIFSTLRKRAEGFAARHPSMARRILGLRPIYVADVKPQPKPPTPERPKPIRLVIREESRGGPKIRALRPSYGNAIVQVVCEVFQITHGRLLSKSRCRREVYPRFAAIKLIRDRGGYSFPEIGRFLGRDHTTCLTGFRRAEALHAEDPSWRALYDKALSLLDAANGTGSAS